MDSPLRLLVALPRFVPQGDSTSLFFERLLGGIESVERVKVGILYGRPPMWAEAETPKRWDSFSFHAPRRKDYPLPLRPLIRLISFLTPWGGGWPHRHHAHSGIQEAVSRFKPDVVLCHDFPVLIEGVQKICPEKTVLWMMEPNPLVPGGRGVRRLRDLLHRPSWIRWAREVAMVCTTWSDKKETLALGKEIGKEIRLLFPGVPPAVSPKKIEPKVGYFGSLRKTHQDWLQPRIASLEEALRERGLHLFFRGLGKDASEWVLEHTSGAVVLDDWISPEQAREEMSSCRFLLSLGGSAIQVLGKTFDYLSSGRPTLHFGPLGNEDGQLLQREGAGRGWHWDTSPQQMKRVVNEILRLPNPDPSVDLSPESEAKGLIKSLRRLGIV